VNVERLEKPAAAERLREPAEAALSLLRRWRMLRQRPWKGFGEPFNGQATRRRTVDLLVREFSPRTLIETGTFLGFTTRCLADYGAPTYTVEVSPRFRYAARFALRDLDNVTMIWGDSAAGVRHLAERTEVTRPLAYLDAHWEEDVPLNAELECLFSSWEDVLVVIDDFSVPGKPGYGYDIYEGVPLSLDELSVPEGVTVAFPAAPAAEETGSRRGTVFLARGKAAGDALATAEREALVTIQRDG
jgi:predicted O-methyltransferase YrrM